MESNFILYKKAKIAYSIYGNGKTIVLLHGFLESSKIWEEFIPHLSQKFQVITIDFPGHGQSESIGYVHNMELMASCVKQVVDQVKITEFLLVGHSMGGYVSLAFAEKYASYLKGLVLFHSSSLADGREKKESRLRAIEAAKQNAVLYINSTIPNLFKADNLAEYKPEVERIKSIARETSTQGIVAALEGMRRRKNRNKVLREFKHPVFFIVGQYDNAVPLKKVLPQLAFAPHTEAIVLHKVGHMGFIEAKQETLAAINAFASKLFM